MTGLRRAVLLLSGGIDSATALALAKNEGYEIHAMTFRYGQRHAIEVEAARRIAHHFGIVEHIVIELDLRAFGGSALTSDLAVPRHQAGASNVIPVTYVPARNTIFLSFALAWSESIGASDIFLGANANDASGYPDCRPAFLRAFERMGDLATREGVEGRQRLTIHAPLCNMTKTETVRVGHRFGVPFELTWTCYDPCADGRACGECDACSIRLRAFQDCGLKDPLDARVATCGGHP